MDGSTTKTTKKSFVNLEKKRRCALLAQEKGFNTYKRTFFVAIGWIANEKYWALVRESWSDLYSKNKNLKLNEKVDGKRMYEILFALPVDTDKRTIEKTIKSFVK